MRDLLYRWVHPHCRPPLWMAYAFYRVSRHKTLYVIFPLNLLLAFLWWLQDLWARHANAPSWIECEVEDRLRESDRLRYNSPSGYSPPSITPRNQPD